MSNVENVSPQVMRGVVKELAALEKEPPDGVKLLLREDNLTDVVAVINGPAGTPYAGGAFRVRIVLGRDFPVSPPRAFFLTKIFHPNVSTSGEVCVNTLKKDWKPELGLTHVLLAIRCLLIAPNPESALNAEAGALLRDHYDDYFRRAKMLTEIHARAPDTTPGSQCALGSHGSQGSHADDEPPSAKRERRPAPRAADKRRILKRL